MNVRKKGHRKAINGNKGLDAEDLCVQVLRCEPFPRVGEEPGP